MPFVVQRRRSRFGCSNPELDQREEAAGESTGLATECVQCSHNLSQELGQGLADWACMSQRPLHCVLQAITRGLGVASPQVWRQSVSSVPTISPRNWARGWLTWACMSQRPLHCVLQAITRGLGVASWLETRATSTARQTARARTGDPQYT
ncbi:hypothetical protein EGW08_016279 [Elysia chlorotica]|uniref:Uncharacterized protein n=1 Tax=Elysia chlorotica TaxID=188477 RepID=A0A433T333_ELYCH|nr:hypothetical protein EGW08_016279 [Elysia chlorotica]